ncbi:MAG: 2OG-Fe(II) oxygenase [Chromatiales bacterium]|nr:2OG-Fe(II) oxygenase [Chromatiales bacterium]
MFNYESISSAGVTQEPFEYFTLPDALSADGLDAARSDFPAISKPGVYDPGALEYGPQFAALIDEISSPRFRAVIEQKFGVDLSDKSLMISVRGQAQKKDGRIHTDAKYKLITGLLYLNDRWNDDGGRLRLLRGPGDMDDYLTEVSPAGGTLVAFRVRPNSWHGHKPFCGERRCVMFNWVDSGVARKRHFIVHRISAFAKRLMPGRAEAY